MRVILLFVTFCFVSSEDDGSYSYHRFRGPVSGQIREVPGYQSKHYVDYVAKPDYLYSYGVEDPKTGTSQVHQESRNGDEVVGEYQVLQPDGFMRIVKYSADGIKGFTATVTYVKV